MLGLGARRVQQLVASGEIVGEKHSGAWRLAAWSVHRYLEDHGPSRPRVSRLSRPPDAPGRTEGDREWVDRVNTLEREIGRLEGRLELTEQTESTIREDRDRLLQERNEQQGRADEERRRADELQRRLDSEVSRGFWSRLFGGKE